MSSLQGETERLGRNQKAGRPRFLRVLVLLPLLLWCSWAGQTQREMNDTACGASHKADLELTQMCDKILAANKADADFVKSFRAAQDAWLAFRAAHIQALYPSSDPGAYGSVNPMCRCNALEQLTKDRIVQVRNLWIRGTAEGDACSGSQPVHKKQAGGSKAAPLPVKK